MLEGERETEEGEAPAPWWKCIVAALPELLVAAQFLMVARTRQPFLGAEPQWLTAAMQAEFLVIHSMAFLGLLALWKPADPKGQKTRAVAFWGLFALYTIMALSAGFAQFLLFVGLTFVTYLGLFLNWNSPSAKLQLGARWAVGFVLFLVALHIFGAPSNVGDWGGRASVLRAGALYFFALAAVELSGLYLRVIPRNSARLLGTLRKSA
jgi:hypothetical protein